MASSPPNSRRRIGYSLTELVTAIAIMGVLAGIAVTQYSGVTEGSKTALATNKLEWLNTAVSQYGMARGEIYVNPSITTVDEQAVVEGLMADHPRILGDPFLPTSYRPQESSSTADYRLQWMGLQFSLLKPGEAGTGLRVPFDGSDFGAPRTVSPDYVIGGR